MTSLPLKPIPNLVYLMIAVYVFTTTAVLILSNSSSVSCAKSCT